MSGVFVASNTAVFDQLHGKVYAVAVDLVAWFALLAWMLFDRGERAIDLSLAIMTALPLVAVLVPLAAVVGPKETPRPA
jgi:hypothetical protein